MMNAIIIEELNCSVLCFRNNVLLAVWKIIRNSFLGSVEEYSNVQRFKCSQNQIHINILICLNHKNIAWKLCHFHSSFSHLLIKRKFEEVYLKQQKVSYFKLKPNSFEMKSLNCKTLNVLWLIASLIFFTNKLSGQFDRMKYCMR